MNGKIKPFNIPNVVDDVDELQAATFGDHS